MRDNASTQIGYSKDDLETLEKQFAGLEGRCNDVIEDYLEWKFLNERAKEHAHQGLCRRLRLMSRCIANVFEALPPESCEAPEENTIHDVTVQLQAFMINTFGCLDNLAQAWVWESDVRRKNGNSLRGQQIGFGSSKTEVRDSLSSNFVSYLSEIQDWYENLESFRHALAHRIPPFIPPGFLNDEQTVEYNNVQAQINDALARGDYIQAERLENEQAALLSFHPVATHSLGEKANLVFFHAQMLSDMGTVLNIASKLLLEFDR